MSQLKCSGDIEPQMEITLGKITIGLCDKCPLRESTRVGDHDLEYVSSGFNVNAYTKRVVIRIVLRHIQTIIIFACERNAFRDLVTPAKPDSKLVVVLC